MDEKPTNKELREKVFELCSSIGFWNIRPTVVAKKLNTAHANISRWKQQWVDKNGLPQIDKYGKELNVHSQLALREIVLLIKDQDPKIKMEAIRTFFQSQERYTKFLENFNYKSKVAEEITVKGEIDLAKAYDSYKKKEALKRGKSTSSGESHS